MSKNNSLHIIKFTLTFLFLFGFAWIIVYANSLAPKQEKIYINNNFIQEWNSDDYYMNFDNIAIEISEDQVWIIKYTVAAWDSLSKISSMFWVTVSHIKKSNSLENWVPIKPWQVIVITNEEEGLVYEIEEDINVKVFSEKYALNLDDVMSINYIQDESEILKAWNQIFVNVTKNKAYETWLLEKPIPVYVPKQTTTYKPVITSPSTNSNVSTSTWPTTSGPAVWWKILSKWTYNKDISNSFYRWHCTWYAAIISPEIFPYTSETTQKRSFGGNGNQWYANAKNAWFPVWSTPRVGAIVSYSRWGTNYWYAGHVAKVISYDPSTGNFVVEEMNYAGKFIVTRRQDNISNWNIIWFIYPK